MATEEGIFKSNLLLHIGRYYPELLVWNHPTGTGRSLTHDGVIRFGLPGSPDIIGLMQTIIKPQHVGLMFGRAIGIECKSATGKQREQQRHFQLAWESRGGIYLLANNLIEFDAAVRECK
jgi:hypothetical protein